MISQLRVGNLNNEREIGLAIRDIEKKINDLISQAPQTLDLASGAHMAVLARGTDGNWHTWTLVSGGGCTITFNDVTHTCTISVP